MSGPVKRRRYESERRRHQAAQTREDILDAANALFVDLGYPGATVAAVAKAAGVSLQTISNSVGTKPELLKALIDARIAGDDDPTPIRERPWVQAIDAEPDPKAKLARYAEVVDQVQQRVGPLMAVLVEAAPSDSTLKALMDDLKAQRLAGMRAFAAMLATQGRLRPGLTPSEAADVLYSIASPEMYELLVRQRSWGRGRYRRWLADTLVAALL